MNDGYRNLPAINQAGVWGCPGTILPIDALAEIPVTGSPEAEFGRSSGATVNIVTKSGSNQIHGSAFEYFRADELGARNYFNSTDPNTGLEQPKNSFTNHQFGGSLGGAIVKDKSFWFVAYEGQRENGGLPQPGVVPTQSYLDANAATTNGVIKALLSQVHPWGPLLSLTDPTIQSVSTTFTIPFLNNSDNLIAKIDQHLHLFSPGDLLTVRYFYSHGIQNFPLNMLYSTSGAPDANIVTPTHVNIASLSYTSVPKSNLIFEFRGGYNRFLEDFLPTDSTFNPASIGLITIPTGDQGSDATHDFGLPTIKINGFSTVGATSSASRGRIDSNYQLFGNVSLTHGRHLFKMGYEWRRTAINSFIDSGHRGSLSFNTLDDFLAGNIADGSSAEGAGTRYSFQNGSGAYFQDSWRLRNRITLNYGLRWDYFGVVGAQNHAFSIFDVKSGTEQTVGAAGGPQSLYPKDWSNFAPRVSLADDLLGNGKLVARSGVGIFYDGPSQDFFVGNQAYNASAGQDGPAFNNILFAGSTVPQIQQNVAVFGNYSPSTLFTVSQKLVTPRYVSYNLNLESQVARKVAVQIGYVGSQGRHLFRLRDLNQADMTSATESCGNGASITYGQHCFQSYNVAPYGAVTLTQVNQVETSALSNYNSMQATLKLQSWHGVTSTLNYTWAHSIDTASDGLDFVPNAAQPDDSFNPGAERASSNFDVRQRLQWYWNYKLPMFAKSKWITGGWALDGNFSFATGQPYTVSYLFEGDYNGSGEGFGRPDILPGVNPHAGAHGINLLNAEAFAAPCTWDSTLNSGSGGCVANTQHPGSEGRNAFNAPNFTVFDFSVTKTSHLTERLTMELRADFFNLFNHPNLSNPLMPNFGLDAFNSSHPETVNGVQRLVAGSGPGSYLQTTTTPDVGGGNPYLGGGAPRCTQLAAHFNF